MRRWLGRAAALLVFSPTPLIADPLSNLGQVFPFLGFLFCVPCAVLTWSLAYRGANGRPRFPAWRVVLVALVVLFVLAWIGFGPAAGLLFALGLVALAAASPFLLLWCALWWWIASRAYRHLRVPPLAIAAVGSILMAGLSCALIWALFPSECRHMFRL
jgi:amino acid transporter